jgi:hypothetical protein
LFGTTSRLSPIGRAEDYREREAAKFAVEAAEAALHFERLYRIQGFPEFPEFVAGRLDALGSGWEVAIQGASSGALASAEPPTVHFAAC